MENANNDLSACFVQDQLFFNFQLGTALSAHEAERSALGIALRNDVAAVLATAKLMLDCAKADPDKRLLFIGDAHTILSSAIEAIRELSDPLLPPALAEIGLCAALDEMLDRVQACTAIDFERCWENQSELRLSGELQLIIFRIIQEQVTNIRDNSGKARVKIRLIDQEQSLLVCITDNVPVQIKKGTNVLNIINKAGMFNGEVRVYENTGYGSEMIVEFKL